MSDFDLDSYLFGQLDSPKKNEDEDEKEIEEVKEEIIEEVKKEVIEEKQPLEPEKDLTDINLAGEVSQSKSFVIETEQPREEKKYIKVEESEKKFEDWKKPVKTEEQSREDIIKSIDFSLKTKHIDEIKDEKEFEPEVDDEDNDDLDNIDKVNESLELETPQSTPLPDPKKVLEKEIDDIKPIYSNPDINENDTPKDNSQAKFFMYVILTILVILLLVLGYIKRDSLPFFNDEPQKQIVNEYEKDEISQDESLDYDTDIDIENNFDSMIDALLNGDYRIKASGGFILLYTVTDNGDEVEKNVRMELGSEDDYTYLHEGRIMYYNTDEGIVVWDQNNTKYILSDIDNEYMVVNENSDLYYSNFLGQHIIQHILDDYLQNKNRITKIGENVWSWNWSFYTPIDEYTTKNILQTQIFLDEETNLINEIHLYHGETEVGKYNLEFEETQPFTNIETYIPNNYVLVDQLRTNY